jgi:hypothetical protein
MAWFADSVLAVPSPADDELRGIPVQYATDDLRRLQGTYLDYIIHAESALDAVIVTFFDIKSDRAPIFSDKVLAETSLFTKVETLREITVVVEQFSDLAERMHSARVFRNRCAHGAQWALVRPDASGHVHAETYFREVRKGKEVKTPVTAAMFEERLAAVEKLASDLYELRRLLEMGAAGLPS